MNWIETPHAFPEIDPCAESYFADADAADAIYAYGFSNLPQLRTLLKTRLGDALTNREATEAAKLAFKHKPQALAPTTASADPSTVVDFIYEM